MLPWVSASSHKVVYITPVTKFLPRLLSFWRIWHKHALIGVGLGYIARPTAICLSPVDWFPYSGAEYMHLAS